MLSSLSRTRSRCSV